MVAQTGQDRAGEQWSSGCKKEQVEKRDMNDDGLKHELNTTIASICSKFPCFAALSEKAIDYL